MMNFIFCLKGLNSFHRNIKFASECSWQEINIFDVIMKVNNNQVVVNLHCKPTDCHQYLHDNSCRQKHIKRSSFYRQRLCTKTLCSEEISLTNLLNCLRSLFCNKDHPESMSEEQLRRVENRTSDELLCSNSCVGEDVGVSLIVAYNPHLNCLNKIMRKSLKHY